MKKLFKKLTGCTLAFTLLTGSVSATDLITPKSTAAFSISFSWINNAVSDKNAPFIAHCQTYGWQDTRWILGNCYAQQSYLKSLKLEEVYDQINTYIGTTGKAKRLEAFIIGDPNVEYCVQYANETGWQEWTTGAPTCTIKGYNMNEWPESAMLKEHMAGTTGQAKAIQAIKIRSKENYYDVFYQVHIQGRGWLNWTKNGNPAGNGHGVRVEAIRVKFMEKNTCAIAPQSEDGQAYAYYN